MKSYRIVLHKKVEKFLLAHPDIGLQFEKKACILQKNPFDIALDTKHLVGTNQKYRLRIGKRRFLYQIIQEDIVIYFYNADSRGQVYK